MPAGELVARVVAGRALVPMSGRCPVYLCTRLYVANIGHARPTSLMSLLPEHAKAESGRNDSKFSFTFRGTDYAGMTYVMVERKRAHLHLLLCSNHENSALLR